MLIEKHIEIIDLNIKEAGKTMPPDVLETLKCASALFKWVRDTRPIGLAAFIKYLED